MCSFATFDCTAHTFVGHNYGMFNIQQYYT